MISFSFHLSLRDCCTLIILAAGLKNPTLWYMSKMWCVDWLRTAAVYTKQKTSCPRRDCGVSNTLILPYLTLPYLPYTFSLFSLRTG